jgi:hypothetical protein
MSRGGRFPHRLLIAIASLAALQLVGCDDAQVNPTGEADLLLGRGTLEAAGSVLGAPWLAEAAVSLDMVESIDVTLTGVQVLALGGDESDEGGWIPLQVVSGGEMDLMQLPGAGEPGVVVATGTLAAGPYGKVRLFFSDATIVLNTEVTISSQVYEAQTPHALTIPSGEQTGIKVPTGGFDVPAGGSDEVTIMFHDEASVRTVTATGGGLQMSPVLTETAGG